MYVFILFIKQAIYINLFCLECTINIPYTLFRIAKTDNNHHQTVANKGLGKPTRYTEFTPNHVYK